MKNLLLASIIAVTASASFARSRPMPAPREVFSLDSRLKVNIAGIPSSDFTLLDNGRWRYQEVVDGKLTKIARGVLPRAKVIEIQEALEPAKWTFKMAELRCMAEAITYSEVSFRGAVVWTDSVCSGKHLDADSQKRLDRVMVIVKPLIASTVK